MRAIAAIAAVVLLATACAASDEETVDDSSAPEAPSDTAPDGASDDASAPPELFPDVVAAEATMSDDGTWRFDVTLSSPYDTPDRYADAWRVVAPDGTVLGVRELLHDHQNEQPFSRSLSGVEIPPDVDEVVIEGRDQVSGWGGDTLELGIG